MKWLESHFYYRNKGDIIIKYKYLTIENNTLKKKTILLRVDLNSPIENNRINNSFRIKNYIETINMLYGNKIILVTHQGRPGKKDFIST